MTESGGLSEPIQDAPAPARGAAFDRVRGVHEVALSQQVARIVTRAAAGRPVAGVVVRAGHLRQIVPEALDHAWAAITKGTPLAAATLTIEPVPAAIACAVCGAETELSDAFRFDCPACGSSDTRVIRGEEFTVVSIDVDTDREE